MRIYFTGSSTLMCPSQSHIYPSTGCRACRRLLAAITKTVAASGFAPTEVIAEPGRGAGALVRLWATREGVTTHVASLDEALRHYRPDAAIVLADPETYTPAAAARKNYAFCARLERDRRHVRAAIERLEREQIAVYVHPKNFNPRLRAG